MMGQMSLSISPTTPHLEISLYPHFPGGLAPLWKDSSHPEGSHTTLSTPLQEWEGDGWEASGWQAGAARQTQRRLQCQRP